MLPTHPSNTQPKGCFVNEPAATQKARELRNWKAPIYNLPNEILAVIFSAEQYRVSYLEFVDSERLSTLPITVSRVTRRWRDVALNAPVLWTQILVSVLQSSEEIQIYLERSHARQLDVTILLDDAESMESLLQLLIPSVNRWRSLIVKSTSGVALEKLSVWFRNLYVPHLQSIDMR